MLRTTIKWRTIIFTVLLLNGHSVSLSLDQIYVTILFIYKYLLTYKRVGSSIYKITDIIYHINIKTCLFE